MCRIYPLKNRNFTQSRNSTWVRKYNSTFEIEFSVSQIYGYSNEPNGNTHHGLNLVYFYLWIAYFISVEKYLALKRKFISEQNIFSTKKYYFFLYSIKNSHFYICYRVGLYIQHIKNSGCSTQIKGIFKPMFIMIVLDLLGTRPIKGSKLVKICTIFIFYSEFDRK